MLNQRSRSYWIGLALQAALIILYCVWTLSMPVFPSQDGPLHLYCVEIFRQLLSHHAGLYSQTYFIHRYVPPYSLYYYGLVLLGKVTSLAMADKLIVCGYFIILPLGLRSLLRAVAGSANWTPLLFMPVLLSWPLMMGFVNYCIAVGFACFALAAWCRNRERPAPWLRLQFFFWLALILLTHPVPWMFVLAFCFFDLALRLLRLWSAKNQTAKNPSANQSEKNESSISILGHFRADLLSALAGCLGYFYLRHFRSPLPPNDPITPIPLVHRTIENAFDYLRTRGLTLYAGTHGAALLYRLGVTLLFAAALYLAVRGCLSLLRQRRWSSPVLWLLFTLLFAIILPTIPVVLNGSYYFAWRLLFLVYLSAVVASSILVERPGRLITAFLLSAVAVTLLNVCLAFRLISPQAQLDATLSQAPVIATDKPGLAMWPAGSWGITDLTFNPQQWAAASYFREHNLLLFNTSWLYVNIIPIKPRPGLLHELDNRYEIRVPWPDGPLMSTPSEAHDLLGRVGFVVAMRLNTPPRQNPFADVEGSPIPGPWAAGWRCLPTPGWSLCVPPGTPLPAPPQ
jgi:hypothetical protein